jgi:hypothetical protein
MAESQTFAVAQYVLKGLVARTPSGILAGLG